jgi:hypothetical protein
MTRSVYALAVRILLSLYLVEAAVLLTLAGIYKTPALDGTLLSTNAGAALMAGGLGLIASVWLLMRQARASGPLRGRAFGLGLTTNLLTVLIACLLLETTVRLAAKTTQRGILFGPVLVRPTWSELTSQSRKVLAGAAPWGTWDRSYFIYDAELGWTVGSNRQSPDGLYFSSVEGIRSAGPNIRMADRTPRFRVALIGDSNAFSFEVPFEDSWGFHLQRLLGDDVQVLNFGVDGYGIDQMYLRYQRDVRPWNPEVVVIGFIDHDLWRTMAVYPFVSFGWPGYLVKPRFVIESGELKLLNVPLPSPNEILSASRVEQLPFFEYDLGYGTMDRYWRFEAGPFILRVLTSAFPRRPIPDPRVSEEATKALNSRLLAQIVESVRQAGAVPVLVLLSDPRDALVRETIVRASVPVLDATECLTGVPAARRRVPSGHHYTGLANLAIARCTAPPVARALRKVRDPTFPNGRRSEPEANPGSY